jgi:hypothetical protein
MKKLSIIIIINSIYNIYNCGGEEIWERNTGWWQKIGEILWKYPGKFVRVSSISWQMQTERVET